MSSPQAAGTPGATSTIRSWVDRLAATEPARFFAVVGLAAGLAFAFVTPPFHTPDEPAHFFRAYTVSEGRLLVRVHGYGPGDPLPESLHRTSEIFTGDVRFHPERRIPPGTWAAGRAVALEPARRKILHYPTAAQYSAVPYLPQGAGVAVGRWLGGGPLTLLFCARIANLLAGIALLTLAIRQLPGYRWLAAVLALLPMTTTLRSSASADAVTTEVAFLLIATTAKLAFGPTGARRQWDLPLLAVCAVALCLTKPVYFPLVLTLFAVRLDDLRPAARRWIRAAVFAVSVGAVVVALALSMPSVQSISPVAEARIDDLTHRPWSVAWLVVQDLATNAPRYGAQFIGRLGWLDTELPAPLILGVAAMLIALTFCEPDRHAAVLRWQRSLFAAAVVGTVFAIGGAIYVFLGRMDGIQGRYYLPASLTAAWIFHRTRRWPFPASQGARLTVMLTSTAALIAALAAVVLRYYG
ncbi:MAG: DUF2142 domain-containing protein [Thermoanaerobaculales bacterium]|nr:DUF2142 domain-containing protein [Thermoanaerobaculales bacterium]